MRLSYSSCWFGLPPRCRSAPEEFSAGTFTISNLGMYGVDHFTAVINPPEAAILAVGAATEEPAVRDGQVVSRMTIKLTLSIDHRAVDGATRPHSYVTSRTPCRSHCASSCDGLGHPSIGLPRWPVGPRRV